MAIQFEKIDRHSFPSGVLDFVVKSNEEGLFAGCMDGIYELRLPAATESSESNKKVKPRRIGRHTSFVSSIAWIESSKSLLSASYDGTFHVRRLLETGDGETGDGETGDGETGDGETGDGETDGVAELAPIVSERLHPFWSWDMALSPDHRFAASVSGQYLVGAEDYSPLASPVPTVKIVDATTGSERHALEMLPSVQCVAFDPTSRYLAAGNLMGDLAVWDVESGNVLAQWRSKSFTSWGITKSHCFIGGVFAVSFSPDGQSLYAAGMGDMRDPMAGNGRQLWQRFCWRKTPVEMTQETIASQAGEGLMETLAWHPSGRHFLMAGRLRGGKWNLGVFDANSGELIGEAKTGMRITQARYSADGQTLYLGGMQGQPGPKENRFPEYGYLERYRVKLS